MLHTISPSTSTDSQVQQNIEKQREKREGNAYLLILEFIVELMKVQLTVYPGMK